MKPDRIVIGADDERAIAAMRARLCAVHAQPRAAAGDGRALGRAHQVRGQRDAGDADLVHERARQPRRATSAPTSSTCARASAPTRASATTSSTRAPATAARASPRTSRRCCTPRRSTGGRCGCSTRSRPPTTRRSCGWSRRSSRGWASDLAGRRVRAVGARLQAQHRRHARGAVRAMIVAALAARGATVVAYDPVAMDEARRVFGAAPWIAYATSPMAAVEGADALVDRHRVEGVPQPRLRRAARARWARRWCSTAATCTTRRGRAPPGSSTSRSAAADGGAGRQPLSAWRERVARTRVLVVGDVMLDRYWFGDVERISPEAPVPVVKIVAHRGAARRRRQRRAQRRGAGRAVDAAVGDRRRRGRRRARPAARRRRRADVVPPRPGAADDGQAARDRPPAAAPADRLRDDAVARGARRQARRLRPPAARLPTSSSCPTTARAASRTSAR